MVCALSDTHGVSVRRSGLWNPQMATRNACPGSWIQILLFTITATEVLPVVKVSPRSNSSHLRQRHSLGWFHATTSLRWARGLFSHAHGLSAFPPSKRGVFITRIPETRRNICESVHQDLEMTKAEVGVFSMYFLFYFILQCGPSLSFPEHPSLL